MICKNCQSENPESNRFCGMCGNPLHGSETLTDSGYSGNDRGAQSSESQSQADPANGASVRRPFIISTTGMGDVASQVLHNRVVLPSRSVGTTSHSGWANPLKPRGEGVAHGEAVVPETAPVDPSDEPMFAQGGVREFNSHSQHPSTEWMDRTAAEPEAHHTALASDEPRPGSILGLSAPFTEREVREFEEPVAYQSQVGAEAPAESVEPVQSEERNSFFQFDEPSSHASNDVSGPSFLGLGAPDSRDYLLEDDRPTSHWRRNLLLFILVIFGGLGFLEWRASQQGDSTNPIDVLHLKLPKKKGQGEVEVMPPSANGPAASPNNAASGSSNNNGKPDLIAEPNQPAVQPQSSTAATPSQPVASSAPASSQPPATSNATPPARPNSEVQGSSTAKPSEADIPVAKSTPPDTSAKPAPPAQDPKPAPPAEVAKSTPPASTKPSASSRSAETNPRSSSKPVASKAAPTAPSELDASLSGGSFELQKGIAAGPTELGRMWLWKAMGKGNGEAPVLLADMYAQGKGVPRDCEQAMLLLNAAAKKANPRARSKLGSMYSAGECVSRDRVQAYKWMSAALQVNPGSEWLERNRESLMNQMTPAERRRAQAYR
jgi:hypothetical protein